MSARLLAAALVGLALGWVLRVPTEPVPEVVVRLVRTPARVVERPDPVTEACLKEHQVALTLLGVAVGEPSTETSCREQIALAVAVTTERQLDQTGRPLPLPSDLPAKYRQQAITTVARQIVETCPELGLKLRDVDCNEYPCMAWFVGPGEPQQCPAWVEEYGSVVTASSGELVGPDGARIRYYGIGPVPPEDVVTPTEPPPDPLNPVGNSMRRLQTRGQDQRERLMAELGARELTVEEKRDDQRQYWADEAAAGNQGALHMLEAMEARWAAEDARSDR